MVRGIFSLRRGVTGIFVFIFFGLIITASYLLEEGQSSEFLKNLPISNLGATTPGGNKGNPGNVAANGRPPKRPNNGHPAPKMKPVPTHVPPPIRDPFPLLERGERPPPIPSYNVPRHEMHHEYGLDYVPPLFIGFTRQWPMLLQCVVSYITAGWPPESIIVVENTGVQFSNRQGKLSLQNPFYLNHAVLKRLGVTVLQTPVLLTFSQMQNFFLSEAHNRAWPYYFYSHQDSLVYSFEDGADTVHRPGDREFEFYDDDEKHDIMNPPAAGKKGYRTIYENALRELNTTLDREDHWAFRWFQYDHLTLVNREAMDAVGGWDNLMPYYGSDCDMNARLAMDGWTMKHRRIGIINDVSTVLDDLIVLYRDKNVEPKWTDPNPPEEKPKEEGKAEEKPKQEEEQEAAASTDEAAAAAAAAAAGATSEAIEGSLSYFRKLVKTGNDMGKYKYRDDEWRNTWQLSQRGGQGEPYYYNSDGFAQSFWILAEAGREVYRQKWGHGGCDLVQETALIPSDAWLVEPDWITDEPAAEKPKDGRR
ncbi:uncharacterized protein B0I36DRAFT_249247 [Microdochium trichocladiopsis]|uniref:Uncharacterized protein n=1 Tax=Microdochium trichocladiopsis TaxID=1682393 RepID=A0A9P9BM14_9PEZI|nr:uncharacterized protein B0I36DRAFT_249247 [Microdochium trichocladiopsis]KAH7025810.1 hypothetical protein B0I36DRAFT_249247 [Microdochium trichocladiopsis]